MDVIDVNVMKLTDWGLYRPSPPRGGGEEIHTEVLYVQVYQGLPAW